MESQNTIIVEQFNAHNPLWHSNLQSDSRGNRLADRRVCADFAAMSEIEHTIVAMATTSSPDISIASSNSAMNISWSSISKLGSDISAITFEVDCMKVKAAKET